MNKIREKIKGKIKNQKKRKKRNWSKAAQNKGKQGKPKKFDENQSKIKVKTLENKENWRNPKNPKKNHYTRVKAVRTVLQCRIDVL